MLMELYPNNDCAFSEQSQKLHHYQLKNDTDLKIPLHVTTHRQLL